MVMRKVIVGFVLAQAASAAWAAHFSCQILTPAPGEVLHALVVGDELVMADISTPALWRYHRSSGRQLGKVGKLGRGAGEYERPFFFFSTEKGYGVFDGLKYALLFFGKDHRFLGEDRLNPEWTAEFLVEAPPAWRDGRFVAYGAVSGMLTGGNDGWLSLYSKGKLTTLLPAQGEDLDRISDVQEGGVCPLEDGSFLAVSPVDYRFFVLSGSGSLVGSFSGVRERYRSPDWFSRPKDRYDRDGYFSWLARQAYVSAPQCLPGGKVAVLVRAPGSPKVFLETYQIKEGRFLGAEEVKVPLKAGDYLVSVASPPGSFFFLVREKYAASSPIRLCGTSLP